MDKPPPSADEAPSRLLSIGAVARSSGLSEATLRVWERRYGIPTPVRLPSGHRRYRPDQVRHLRLVSEALAQGSRPGEVLRVPLEDLPNFVSKGRLSEPSEEVQGWIMSFRDLPLRNYLIAMQEQMGLVSFLDTLVGPLLAWLGTSWARGEIEVRHEHFVTEIIEDHLRHMRMRTLEENRPEPTGMILLASLPQEQHGLGLCMVALVCDLVGVGQRLLGTSTPIEDVAAAASAVNADAVAISIPVSEQGAVLYRRVDELRSALKPEIALLMGGMGVKRIRRSPSGVERVASMADWATWLEERYSKALPKSM